VEEEKLIRSDALVKCVALASQMTRGWKKGRLKK
jgi:hypothetical protein